MPPKMLTSTPFTSLSREDDAEGFGHLFDVGAAADVEEIGRLAAVQFDEVHRAHRQPGAVDQAADVAVQPDVAQPGLAGRTSVGFFLGQIAEPVSSGWRNRALSSKLILASSASISPASVTTSGLISSQAAIAGDECPAELLHEFFRRFSGGGVEHSRAASFRT